jgi:hypothetical protein
MDKEELQARGKVILRVKLGGSKVGDIDCNVYASLGFACRPQIGLVPYKSPCGNEWYIRMNDYHYILLTRMIELVQCILRHDAGVVSYTDAGVI